ncbi:hypothetical protein RND81_10G103800 [Saponaria officinalis]|uniref:Uncharacterized protein n=1 Tax=Saponaria officinalis TaxID=3572 RepID=A0AAW1I0N5_SAPOF
MDDQLQEQHNNSEKSFIFKTQQTHILKASISALCDPEFNPDGLARIDVDDKNLQLTVSNVQPSVLGILKFQCINSDDDFIYNTPFDSRMLHLNHILRYLALAHDHDSVTIYHVLESDQLTFVFGSNPPIEFSAKLLEPVAEFRQYPDVLGSCGVILPTEDLRQMISSMFQDENPRNVLVKMSEKNVTVAVGNNKWRYGGDEIHATKWNPGVELSWYFRWPQHELLKYTSYLSKRFTLCFLDDPPQSVMFWFSVSERWDLKYITSSIDNLKKSVIYAFRFQLNSVGFLKRALHSLTNWKFCVSPGLGMIRVSKTRFDIVVRNADTGVIGFIHLEDAGLMNFKCENLVEPQMVNVNDIARNLSLAHDNDSVSFSQVQGSNEINYRTGPNKVRTHAAELLEMDEQFRECPYHVTIVCEVTLASKDLQEMAEPLVKNKKPQTG